MAKKKAVKKSVLKKTFKKSALKKSIAKPNIKKSTSKKPSQGLAIAALILNVIILPGLGSLIGGKTKEGIWQVIIFIVGLALSIILIGIPLIIGAWVWGLITGIQLINESS